MDLLEIKKIDKISPSDSTKIPLNCLEIIEGTALLKLILVTLRLESISSITAIVPYKLNA